MWIIKIGGSWIKNPQLNKLIDLLHRFSKFEKIVIVAGGGCFSDSVRGVFSSNMMSEKTGHFLALKATEIFSYMLKEMKKEILLEKKIDSLLKFNKKLVIWMPSSILKEENSFYKNWDSTSDSVATWLYKKTKSKGLLFVKSIMLEKKKYKLSYLQKNNILDKNVNKYLDKKKYLKIIGPNIIEVLESASNWNEAILKFSEVET